ncbi:MAG: ABC transporter substrate-binding protein [Variibacter sp.]|nr:ABC transporter substrate-binding protein [Variibacter sp.]
MPRLVLRAAVLALTALFASQAAQAQEPPALSAATGPEKDRLKALIEQAKKEGAVNYIDGLITPQAHDALSEAFRKHYGLPASFKVGNTDMAPSGIITRLGQEMRANRLTFDVGAVASPAWVRGRLAEGKIIKYESPEYANYKTSLDQQMGLKDHFVLNAAYTFTPTWNTETTTFDGTSWKDMVKIPDQVPVGRYSSSDCGVTDSTLLTYMGVRKILSVDDYKKLAAGKPVYSYKSENTLSRVIAGEDLFALYGLTAHMQKFNAKGAKLKHLEPKEGYVLLPQVMFVIANSPHPAAAKLWFDFVLSQQGQDIFMKKEMLISGRSGFKSPIPGVPSIDHVKTIHMDWLKMSEDDLQHARTEWSSMFKGGKQRN